MEKLRKALLSRWEDRASWSGTRGLRGPDPGDAWSGTRGMRGPGPGRGMIQDMLRPEFRSPKFWLSVFKTCLSFASIY